MSLTLTSTDSILADEFSKLLTFRDVARLLDVHPIKLKYYLLHRSNYKIFELRKRNGGTRTIKTPVTALKIIQRKLNQVLHAVYRGRSPVHGFVRERSIVTNANRHVDREWLLNLDLEDFFPSIHFGRVKGLFESKPYRCLEPVAVTLAQICCHGGALPIGAPTSPIVANMICAQMDSQLRRLAVECGCRYTRYADDITFSVEHGRFPPTIVYRDPSSQRWIIGEELARIVTSNSFRINPRKTRVLRRGDRQEVTGLIVGDRVNVKRSLIRQVRNMLHAAERWGVARAGAEFESKFDVRQRKLKPDFMRVVRGKIEFVGSVRGRDDIIYLRLLDRLLALDKQARSRSVVPSAGAVASVLERAVWLLEENDGPLQGTGFAADGLGLVTAAHVVTPATRAYCPALGIANIQTRIDRAESHVDVARLSVSVRLPVQLRIGTSANLKVGDPIKVLGFPLHRAGNSVHMQSGRITAVGQWHSVPHLIVDCPIIRGNSGGPVLNGQNEVVGIAVKGQGTPKVFGDDDELSRFVPIEYALQHLR